MTTHTPKQGAPFQPLVNLHTDRQWLPDLERKIAACDAAWWLGGCILGFIAPAQVYPLTREEYSLQAWLLYERLYPDHATRLLAVMKECTGHDCQPEKGQ